MPFERHRAFLFDIEKKEHFILLHAVNSPTCVGYHHPDCHDRHILFVYIDTRYSPSHFPPKKLLLDDRLCYRAIYENDVYTGYPLHVLLSGLPLGSSQAMGILKSEQVIYSLPSVYKSLELVGGVYYNNQLLAENYLKHARRHFINSQMGCVPNQSVLFLYLLLNCLAVKQCHYYVKFTFNVNQLIDQSHLFRRTRSLLKELYAAYRNNTFSDICQGEEYNELINLLYNYAKKEGRDKRKVDIVDTGFLEETYQRLIKQYRY